MLMFIGFSCCRSCYYYFIIFFSSAAHSICSMCAPLFIVKRSALCVSSYLTDFLIYVFAQSFVFFCFHWLWFILSPIFFLLQNHLLVCFIFCVSFCSSLVCVEYIRFNACTILYVKLYKGKNSQKRKTIQKLYFFSFLSMQQKRYANCRL